METHLWVCLCWCLQKGLEKRKAQSAWRGTDYPMGWDPKLNKGDRKQSFLTVDAM